MASLPNITITKCKATYKAKNWMIYRAYGSYALSSILWTVDETTVWFHLPNNFQLSGGLCVANCNHIFVWYCNGHIYSI